MNSNIQSNCFKVFLIRSLTIVIGFLMFNVISFLLTQKNILIFIEDYFYSATDFDKIEITRILLDNVVILFCILSLKLLSKFVTYFYFFGFRKEDLKKCLKNIIPVKESTKEKVKETTGISIGIVLLVIKELLRLSVICVISFIITFVSMMGGVISIGGFAIVFGISFIFLLIYIMFSFSSLLLPVFLPFLVYFFCDVLSSVFIYKFFGYKITPVSAKFRNKETSHRFLRFFFSVSDIILAIVCSILASEFVINMLPSLYAKYEDSASLTTPLALTMFAIIFVLYCISSYIILTFKNYVLFKYNILQIDDELTETIERNRRNKEFKKQGYKKIDDRKEEVKYEENTD